MGWLQLARLPNLPTVPGDPIAGFLLAVGAVGPVSVARLLPIVAASLCLYISGVILNDCVDYSEDSSARPDRPLPSGMVPVSRALAAGVLLGFAGVGLAFLGGRVTGGVALILFGAVVMYNSVAKNLPIVGPLVMGLCRGLSLLLGAMAGGWQPRLGGVPLLAGVGLLLYIAAVTAVASRETEKHTVGFKRWLPAAALVLCLLTMAMPAGETGILFVGLAVVTVGRSLFLGKALAGAPLPAVVRLCVGQFIKGLLLLQITFCAVCLPYGLWGIGFILAMWPLSTLLGKRFESS